MKPLPNILLLITIALVCSLVAGRAQSPTPFIVQAANQPGSTPPPPAKTAAPTAESVETLKSLQELKAANEETLKKQEAILQKLEELQQEAEQVKIFAHRG